MFHVKHPALLYGNMPMQQKSRPLRSGFVLDKVKSRARAENGMKCHRLS